MSVWQKSWFDLDKALPNKLDQGIRVILQQKSWIERESDQLVLTEWLIWRLIRSGQSMRGHIGGFGHWKASVCVEELR